LRLSTSLALLPFQQHPTVLPAQVAHSLPVRGTKFQKSSKWSCRAVTCRGLSQRASTLSSTTTTSAGAVVQASSTVPETHRASGAPNGANGIISIAIAMAFVRPTVSSRCIASTTSQRLRHARFVFEQRGNWTSPIYSYGLFSALTRARNVSMCTILNVSVRYAKLRLPALPRPIPAKMSGFQLSSPSTWFGGRSPPRETTPQPAQDGKEPEKNADLELGATVTLAPEEPSKSSDDPPEPSLTLTQVAQRTTHKCLNIL
jgi:hypothetical protein